MFNLYIDRQEHYDLIEQETGETYNKEVSKLFCYLKEGGFVIFILDRYCKDVSVECSIFGIGKWASKSILKHFCDFVFNKCNCKRMTCITRETNNKSIKLNKRLGMVKEGVLQRATTNNEPLIIWGWYKENCKYIGK